MVHEGRRVRAAEGLRYSQDLLPDGQRPTWLGLEADFCSIVECGPLRVFERVPIYGYSRVTFHRIFDPLRRLFSLIQWLRRQHA